VILTKVFDKLCFGGSVLGWSVSEKNSQRLLSYFVANGGGYIDTSDYYSEWVPGNQGGESELIIGNWHHKNSLRRDISIITKVGISKNRPGFNSQNILEAANDSLKRLKTDYIDVYMPHRDLNSHEQQNWCESATRLHKEGKILSIGFSHCKLETMQSIVNLLNGESVPISIVESNFNLLEQDESKLSVQWAEASGFQFMAARGLAGGFLSGKYRRHSNQQIRILFGILSHLRSRGKVAIKQSYRSSLNSASVASYIIDDNYVLLKSVQKLARKYDVSAASIVYSWLISQQGINLACISFRTLAQLRSMRIVALEESETNALQIK
jgi:aryl-alcohol dehydrogenase-like predicted oxidoreductase